MYFIEVEKFPHILIYLLVENYVKFYMNIWRDFVPPNRFYKNYFTLHLASGIGVPLNFDPPHALKNIEPANKANKIIANFFIKYSLFWI